MPIDCAKKQKKNSYQKKRKMQKSPAKTETSLRRFNTHRGLCKSEERENICEGTKFEARATGKEEGRSGGKVEGKLPEVNTRSMSGEQNYINRRVQGGSG